MVAHGLSFFEPVEIYLDGPLGSRIDGIILPPNEEDKKKEVSTIAFFPTRTGKYTLHINVNSPFVPISNSPFTFGMNTHLPHILVARIPLSTFQRPLQVFDNSFDAIYN